VTDHDDLLYLVHIDETARQIARSVTARGRECLATDADLRDATLYRLQTLAESTQRLSPELKVAHPEIPWEDIAAFRNRIVHGYLGVSLDIVWDITQRDLPELGHLARTEVRRRREMSGLQLNADDELGL